MTDSTQRFIPLSSDSQGDSENVLFYDKDASFEAIYNCATGRIQAVINLLVNLYEYHNSDPLFGRKSIVGFRYIPITRIYQIWLAVERYLL